MLKETQVRGRDLRWMRKKARITQLQLRAILGWDIWKLVRIENEDVLPTPEDKARLLEAIYCLARKKMAEEKAEEKELASLR